MTLTDDEKLQLGLAAIKQFFDEHVHDPSNYSAEGLRELAISVELGKLLTRHSGGGWIACNDALQNTVDAARNSDRVADWTLRRLPRLARGLGAPLPEFALDYVDEALQRAPSGIGKAATGDEWRAWLICRLMAVVKAATGLPDQPNDYDSLNCAQIVADGLSDMPFLNHKTGKPLSAESISGIFKSRFKPDGFIPSPRSAL